MYRIIWGMLGQLSRFQLILSYVGSRIVGWKAFLFEGMESFVQLAVTAVVGSWSFNAVCVCPDLSETVK